MFFFKFDTCFIFYSRFFEKPSQRLIQLHIHGLVYTPRSGFSSHFLGRPLLGNVFHRATTEEKFAVSTPRISRNENLVMGAQLSNESSQGLPLRGRARVRGRDISNVCLCRSRHRHTDGRLKLGTGARTSGTSKAELASN